MKVIGKFLYQRRVTCYVTGLTYFQVRELHLFGNRSFVFCTNKCINFGPSMMQNCDEDQPTANRAGDLGVGNGITTYRTYSKMTCRLGQMMTSSRLKRSPSVLNMPVTTVNNKVGQQCILIFKYILLPPPLSDIY